MTSPKDHLGSPPRNSTARVPTPSTVRMPSDISTTMESSGAAQAFGSSRDGSSCAPTERARRRQGSSAMQDKRQAMREAYSRGEL